MRIKRLALGTVGFGLTALAAGLLYQFLGSRRDQARYAPTGRMVDVRGHRFHVHETGAGSPSVVLEAGIGSSSLSWATVQPEISKFARVCSYDRAGLGWSDWPADNWPTKERLLPNIVEELRLLLEAIQLPYPRILVGHSFGGLVVRAYAALHPEGIAGVVLVDPLFPEEWTEAPESQKRLLALGARLSKRGAWLARFGVVRFALRLLASGSRRIPLWIARASSGSGTGVASRLVGEVQKLPAALWPVVQAHWSNPKAFTSMAAHLKALPANALSGSVLSIPRTIPVTILSAANAPEAQRREWDRIAGTHVTAEKSGHWIQFDQPELVISAIRDLVKNERNQAGGLL